MPPDRNPARVHRIGPRIPPLPQQQVEQLIDRHQLSLVIETGKIGRVTEAARDLGLPEPRLERLVGRRAAQKAGEPLVALRCGSNDRPLGHQPAQHRRLALRHDLALEPLPI